MASPRRVTTTTSIAPFTGSSMPSCPALDRCASAWLQEFTFATRSEAEQQLRFYDTYRSYIVNYRLGEDLVGQYIDRVAGTDPDARWKAFSALLASPPVVSDLARGTTLDPSR